MTFTANQHGPSGDNLGSPRNPMPVGRRAARLRTIQVYERWLAGNCVQCGGETRWECTKHGHEFVSPPPGVDDVRGVIEGWLKELQDATD